MDYFTETKIQISPCIAAKAKFALNLTKKKPTNIKPCSFQYWRKVIESLSSQNNLSAIVTENAIKQFNFLIKIKK